MNIKLNPSWKLGDAASLILFPLAEIFGKKNGAKIVPLHASETVRVLVMYYGERTP
jgi:hypothetical protein